MDPRDHIEIERLYALYGHTMDAGDAEGWASLFSPDGSWDRVEQPGGEAVFSVKGHADLTAFAREDYAARGAGAGRHWMGNVLIDGDTTRAQGRSYGFLIQLIEGEVKWIAHGNFEDDFVKLDEGWRFARRAVCLLGDSDVPSELR
jgi:hypothetical protein